MRSVALMFIGSIVGFTALAALGGCTLPTAQAYACPPGVPWVPDGYANAKYVPGHCLGQAAK